jgi:predicted transcriptional regulator
MGPLKGRADQDKIRHYLRKIEQNGFLEEYHGSPHNYKYNFDADRFLLKGGYVQEYYDSLRTGTEEDVGSIFEAAISRAIDNKIKEVFKDISDSLNRIAKEFENEEADWFNIGNSCRTVLKEFVRELESNSIITIGKDEQLGNVKLQLGKLASGRLKKLIDSVWDYCQTIIHRKETTKNEAIRIFIWTTLTINEIATVLGNED